MTKKTIYTLNIDGYSKEITDLTYPLMMRYALKINAEFFIIRTRQWPKLPPVYEKLQIYTLGKAHQNDWNIYIDSDTLVHPDLFDVTEFLDKDTVMQNGSDMANIRWRYDDYFRRDGRNIGTCNWFTVASDWCLDLWHPLDDLTPEEALLNCFPTATEIRSGMTKHHMIEDYTLSRNVARYGLKYTTLKQIQKAISDERDYLWHKYLLTTAQKVVKLKETLKAWDLV